MAASPWPVAAPQKVISPCSARSCRRRAELRNARRIQTQISVIFQQFNLVNRRTVLTNLLTGFLGQISGPRGTFSLFNRSEKQTAPQALHRVGIARMAGQRASTLSAGQQQHTVIARAQGAEIILANEPITSLNPASSKRVIETLADINRDDGRTIPVSLHQVDYAIPIAPASWPCVTVKSYTTDRTHPCSRTAHSFHGDELIGINTDDGNSDVTVLHAKVEPITLSA